MSNEGHTHTAIQAALAAIQAGRPGSWDDLARASHHRLLRITRSAMARYQRLRRWEESADVLQKAQLELYQYCRDGSPDSPCDYLNLAARIIRNVLVNLARHHFGPQGRGTHHFTPDLHATPVAGAAPVGEADPAFLARWTELHERIALMPDKERETFHLRWYLGMQHNEIAQALGVKEETVKKRWMRARLWLGEAFEEFPL